MITVAKSNNSKQQKKERINNIMGKKSFAKKDNFWNKLRAEKGIKIREVADFLHRGEGVVGMYFSGQLMPDDNAVKVLCDFFDVDFNKGVLEFQHAHKSWKAEHHATVKYRPASSDTELTKTESTTSGQPVVEEILKTLYGVLSCEDFVSVYNYLVSGTTPDVNIGELIYGKLNRTTYHKILGMLNNSDNKDKWSV